MYLGPLSDAEDDFFVESRSASPTEVPTSVPAYLWRRFGPTVRFLAWFCTGMALSMLCFAHLSDYKGLPPGLYEYEYLALALLLGASLGVVLWALSGFVVESIKSGVKQAAQEVRTIRSDIESIRGRQRSAEEQQGDISLVETKAEETT